LGLRGTRKEEKVNDCYSSPNIVRLIKSRGMRGAGHVARMGRGEEYTEFWWGNLNVRGHLGDPGVDGMMWGFEMDAAGSG
jgi:hypothetical protein